MSPHKHVIGCKSHDQTPMVYIAACYAPKTWRKPCKSWNAKALVVYGFLVMTTVGIWWPLSVYCMHSLPLGSHFGDNVWLLVCLLPPTMTWKTSKTLHPSPSPTLTNSWMTPKTSNQGGSIHLCRPESLVYPWCQSPLALLAVLSTVNHHKSFICTRGGPRTPQLVLTVTTISDAVLTAWWWSAASSNRRLTIYFD